VNCVLIKGIKETAWIFLIAAILGTIVNLFHPRGVKISSKRPALKFAADTVLAQDLPGVSVTADGVKTNKNKNETIEPLLITTAQVLQLKESHQAVIIDSRPKVEFLNAHIPGAINLPYKNLSEYKTKIDSLPQDSWLICYCNGLPCDQGELLAYELIIAGYELVAVYFDGLDGWKKSGNEIEGKEAGKDAK
jgi:rhodanese-related sulfurtransferase